MTPRLSKGAVVEIERRVDRIFDNLLTRLLGGYFTGKHMFIQVDPIMSLPGLYTQAVSEEGGNVDVDFLQNLADTVKHLVDQYRSTAKGVTVRRIQALLHDVHVGVLKPEDLRNAIESEMVDTWDRISSKVETVVNTESQHAVTLGFKEGIDHINALRGIQDPVVVFIPKQDHALCDECRRTHLIGTTPRCWYHSEVSADYHQRGEDKPSWHLMHPHCFAEGARLHTDRGVLTVEELFKEGGNVGVVVDDRVKRRSRRARRGLSTETVWLDRHVAGATTKLASHVYYTGVQECLLITLDSGHQQTVSVGHEVWVDDGSVGVKVRADQLRIGAKVPLLSGEGAYGAQAFPDVAELMGNCLGDGSVSRAQASWRFFGEDIPYGQELWSRARVLIQSVLGGRELRKCLRVIPPGAKYSVPSAGFASATLKKMMAQFGLENKSSRRIPEAVWRANKQTQTAFLRGLYAADGHSEATPSVVLAQNDLAFLREVQILLSNVGYASRIFEHGKGGSKSLLWADGTKQETHRAPCWRLCIGGVEQVKKFAVEVGLGVPAKQLKLLEYLAAVVIDTAHGSWRTARVVSIEPVGLKQTFCVTEPETNTVTCGGVVTGNCRCAIATILPGFGFDAGGRVTFIADGFLELEYQRQSSGALGGVDDRRKWHLGRA